MEEILKYTRLYDLYKGLLTEHQGSVFEDYFLENLTLEEIAENNGTSMNAVSKTIKSIKESLDKYESKMHFLEYVDNIKNEFKSEADILNRIDKYDNIIL